MKLVLGGGIGGLSAAHYLLKGGARDVTVLEASKGVGGWIRTLKDPVNDLYFETGPRTLRVRGPAAANTLSLIEEIGLSHKVQAITGDHPSAKNRMIYVNGSLHLLPSSFGSIFKKVQPFSKPIALNILRDLTAPVKRCEDDSVYDFVERRAGPELADYLVSSMICGICAGSSKEISVKFLMPHLFEMEQKNGSILKGFFKNFTKKTKTDKVKETSSALLEKAAAEKWSIFGFDGGMEVFPNELHKRVVKDGARLVLDSPVTKLTFTGKEVKYEVNNGTTEHCEHVVSAIPARQLAPLLQHDHPTLARELSSIPFVNVGVVNLAYKGKVLSKDAFGFLIPPSQNIPILGVVFDSCNFSQGDWTVLTVMMGGAFFKKYFGDNPREEHLRDTAIDQTRQILKINEEPAITRTSIMNQCIPQYVVGHYERVERMFSYIEANKLPLSLVGSSYKGIGVNDVILSAKNAAAQITKSS